MKEMSVQIGPPRKTTTHNIFYRKTASRHQRARCGKCGRDAEACKYRLFSKSPNTWMCTGCNTKGAALSRDFKWPPRSFSGMSAQWQQDFWLGITDKDLNPS